MVSKFWKDAGERVLWTFLAAAVSTAAIYAADLPMEWSPIATTLLTTLKVLVARHIGNPESAGISKG